MSSIKSSKKLTEEEIDEARYARADAKEAAKKAVKKIKPSQEEIMEARYAKADAKEAKRRKF